MIWIATSFEDETVWLVEASTEGGARSLLSADGVPDETYDLEEAVFIGGVAQLPSMQSNSR